MILAMLTVTGLVIASILIHYEVMRLTMTHLRELPVPPRMRVLGVVVALFAAHTAEVWLYGIGYWLLLGRMTPGGFGGEQMPAGFAGFEECLYFSAVTYTSLGFGDLYPVGHFRLIAGVEALNGLLLIGWSASFAYIAMERFWPLNSTLRRGRGE
jgi:hypothetical protein